MAEEEGQKLVLDARSFTSPERLECQRRFDAHFGDLLRCLFEAVDVRREGPMTIQIVDREGDQHFPDQIIQFMVWVQAKRDDPDVELSSFDNLKLTDLNGAHIRGLLGKAEPTESGSKKKSKRGRSSADSSD